MPRERNCLCPDMSRPALSIRRSLAADQSSNMLEVLQEGIAAQRPPSPQRSRVRNLGISIKERGELCQWFPLMAQELPHPRISSPSRQTALLGETESSSSDPVAKKMDTTSNATVSTASEFCSSARVIRTHQTEDSGTTLVSGDLVGSECLENKVELGVDPVKSAGSEDTISAHAEVEEEPTYEEQLNRIQEQQRKLLEQQRAIEEKLGRKQLELNHNNAAAQTESEAFASSQLPPKKGFKMEPEFRRRRLKGSLASQYAERDEGCVGSLLRIHGGNFGEEAAPPPASKQASLSSVSAGRQANLKQDSSKSIIQLLNYCNRPGDESVNNSMDKLTTKDTTCGSHDIYQDNSECDCSTSTYPSTT
ncbi:hypothetical protein PoB_002206400 [Plakobranchus ocellatus]|uniref:Uncharacterized protein n=1 Tax=Plakobranchus ocellatus TaxID=259542 RepID=A0AAV3ZNV7_9GAST|nr:hypothetical protein PoB_002206400 [Plakobranchus ocellatus]